MEQPPNKETQESSGGDGVTHQITWQGKLLTWRVDKGDRPVPPVGERGEVKGFSQASRLRMLKTIATIDWEKCLPCLFFTATFPDECGKQDGETLKSARSAFQKRLERNLDKQVAMLWRVEWEARKTGIFKDQLMPHVHMLIFKHYFIDKELIRSWWRELLGAKETVVTYIKRAYSSKQAGLYVAKYAAKLESNVLDNGLYLAAPPGRKWGILRKNLVPFCPIKSVVIRSNDAVDIFHDEQAPIPKWLRRFNLDSFTVLGDRGEAIGEHIFNDGVEWDIGTG